MPDKVSLTMRMTPVRQYPTLKAWDLFPTINGTSGLANDLNKIVTMPATCNRQRVYVAAMIIGNASIALANPIGNLDAKLKGYDAMGQLMAELPIGFHIYQSASNGITAKNLALPTGYSEVRTFNRATALTAPQTYATIICQYGWTLRGGEMANLDSSGSGSAGNAGISDFRDCMVLAGETEIALAGTSNGFAVTVAPWTIEAPITEWRLDGSWRNTAVGQALGLTSTGAIIAVVFGFFVGEQV